MRVARKNAFFIKEVWHPVIPYLVQILQYSTACSKVRTRIIAFTIVSVSAYACTAITQ